jgi:predicted flap endonuclease-1-like 5' DNA nuclease
MVALVQAYWWVFLIALLIGLVTGYWAWARGNNADRHHVDSEADRAAQSGSTTTGAGVASAATAAAMPSTASDEVSRTFATVSGGVDADQGNVAKQADAGSVPSAAIPNIAAAVGDPDDLLKIKGIGPKLSALCHSLGVTRFDQIAQWSAAEIAEVDRHLGTFRGRIERDGWVEQASLLARGEISAFEAKFGKIDSENK